MTRLRDPRWRVVGVLAAAAVLAGILIGASQISTSEPDTTGPSPAPQAVEDSTVSATSLFAGVEQRGAALGSPKAPVTLVEYADLQCPYCAQWSLATMPTLVDEYVRTGRLRIVFRGLAFIGPDSEKALRTAIAAGRANHMWEVVHGLYGNQGAENAGWVTDDLVTEIAAGIPSLDGTKLLEARWGRSIEPELRRAAVAAERAGVRGTPAFELGPTGGPLTLIQVGSLGPEGIVPSIEAALAA